MRSFVVFLLTGILSFVAGLFYPWWSLAIIAFIVSFILKQQPFIAFCSAFVAIFIFWFGVSYFVDLANDHILANRMSQLFLSAKMPIMMSVLSGLVGGIVAGFSALTASFLRYRKDKNPQKKHPYNYKAT